MRLPALNDDDKAALVVLAQMGHPMTMDEVFDSLITDVREVARRAVAKLWQRNYVTAVDSGSDREGKYLPIRFEPTDRGFEIATALMNEEDMAA